MHKHGKIVAVFIDKASEQFNTECRDFYHKVYDLGIDMVTTDYPEEADRMLSEYHQTQTNEHSSLDGSVNTTSKSIQLP